MSDDLRRMRGAAIPSGRLSRLARFGGLVGQVAGDAAYHGVRRWAAGERPSLETLLMTPANARRVADQLAQMRGAAMKVGQLLSMEAGEILPPELSDILARLRADAEPMPPRQLKTVLVAAWGRGFMARFERFDVRPIAAASIGQVHRAVTKDGRDLALKIQYPGVRDSIDSDVANVATLIKLSGLAPAGLDLAPLLSEAKRQLRDEADYAREGRCLTEFRALLADDDRVRAPAFHADLSTDTILAMDFIDSRPIETLAGASQQERDRVMGVLIDLLLREIFEFRLMQSDPNFANHRYDAATGRLVLLDFGATRALPPALVDVYGRFLATGLSGDRAALRAGAIEMGYFGAETPPASQEAILDMIELGFEPLRTCGPYDFAGARLVDRMREPGLALAADRDVAEIPPIDTLFLQRKVAGLFLLAAKLRARVDVNRRLAAFL